MKRHRFYIPVTTEPEQDESVEEQEEEELPSIKVSVRRSSRIQQPTQLPNSEAPMPDAPIPLAGKFVIIPPTLTEEQKQEYVRYEEDNEGNLL